MWVQKSLDMKNLFLSPKIKSSDFTKIFILIDQIQKEQRHARGDLKQIMHMISNILDMANEATPQNQSEDIPEQEGI